MDKKRDFQFFLRKYFGWAIDAIASLIGKINWKPRHSISLNEKSKIMSMLEKDYYIICTRHDNHLSTYAIAFAGWITGTGWGHYGHVLMNLEDEVNTETDFRLVEAIGSGSQYSSFEEVFGNASSVCLLKPKNIKIEEWTLILDSAKNQVGKPYDTLFDLADDKKVSCVELVREALQGTPNYENDFANLEKMISEINNLTPQMFRDCEDFEVAFEVKH